MTEEGWIHIVEGWIRRARIADQDHRAMCWFSGILMVMVFILLAVLCVAGSGAGWW